MSYVRLQAVPTGTPDIRFPDFGETVEQQMTVIALRSNNSLQARSDWLAG